MILGIDTSSALTSVALVDAGRTLAYAEHDDARQHGEVLALLVERVLGQGDGLGVRCIACGVGPGPYTGLRVGVATATALGLAWQVPVHGVCSLDALADRLAKGSRGENATSPFVVASDARRREVYWARYDLDGSRVAGPHVGRADELDLTLRQQPWMGEGAALAADAVNFTGDADRPTAADVAALVERLVAGGEPVGPQVGQLATHGTDDGGTATALSGVRLLPPTPLYVRRPDAMAG